MLASAAGATTFLGSTTLASILGTATLAATPVGWIIGSAIGGATIFYTVGKFIRSGAANDERRKRMKEDLKAKLASHTLRACLETHLSIMKRFNSMLAMAI